MAPVLLKSRFVSGVNMPTRMLDVGHRPIAMTRKRGHCGLCCAFFLPKNARPNWENYMHDPHPHPKASEPEQTEHSLLTILEELRAALKDDDAALEEEAKAPLKPDPNHNNAS